MNDQLIVRRTRRIVSDNFKIYKTNGRESRDRPLIDYLTFNGDDYYIYKTTGKQKEVTYDEMLEFRYSGYTFFKKELYKREDINKWIEFLYTFTSIPYLSIPFPPIEMMKKITIKK